MQNMPIGIFRGDDTDAFSYQTIVGTIKTDLDLTGCKAVFRYLGFSMEFDPIPEDRKLTIVIPADETKKFPPGLGYASLRAYDSEGRLKTFSNRIMVFVATKTPMFGSDEFEVDFNVRASLEPLKFFVGPNPDDFDEYRGYVEKVIDRASASKYGLAILLDAIDSDLGANDGVAATPVAVKAAYAAIIQKLTDDYYTAEQTDEAIDRVAAYYITYDAAGNPFPTYAALANAQTVYSGGQVRTPTRNDYCVVLADETHQGAEYRYIYAVAEGQTTGSWQAQFPVGGVMTIDQTVTKNSTNPVASGGVWSAIWGALSALPTGFSSLYDWCVEQLAGKVPTSRTVNGKPLSSDVTLTGADIEAAEGSGVTIATALESIGATAGQAAADATTALQDLANKANDADVVHKSGDTMTGHLVMAEQHGIAFGNEALRIFQSAGKIHVHDFSTEYGSDLIPDGSPFATQFNLNTKANRASPSTAGNLAALDANGSPTDSTIPAANVATKGNIPYDRITITTGQLQDHAEQKVMLNAATTTLSLPALTDLTGKVSDFGIDVVNGYEVSGTPTAASFSLAGTIGTDYNLIVPEGEDWSEMSALAAGEMAVYYFTLSAFQINDKPTWEVMKKVVELVPVPVAP